MEILLASIILILAVGLIFLILIQESKGGGLVSSIGGVGKAAEFFGVRRATEDVEKITWWVAGTIAVLAFVINIWLSTSVAPAGGQDTLLLQKGLKNAPVTAPTQVPSLPQSAPKK